MTARLTRAWGGVGRGIERRVGALDQGEATTESAEVALKRIEEQRRRKRA